MKAAWYEWSNRSGLVEPPRRVKRLPEGAAVSTCGGWAEVRDSHGVKKVLVRLGGAL